MKNAERYSLRQAKLESPARKWTAALREGARKKAKLKPRMLNVRILCAQRLKNPVERCGAAEPAQLRLRAKPKDSGCGFLK